MNPEVTIIMPTLNRSKYLGEALLSIKNQSFSNWKCLIIDDGSSDDTKDVISPFISSDYRFKYLKRGNEYCPGPSGARNQGLDFAKSDYIVFFDSDDVVHPETLNICLNLLRKSPEAKFCNYEKKPFWGDAITTFPQVNSSGPIGIIDLKNTEDLVTQKIGFACCTVLWRSEVFDFERFNEDLSYAEEWELYLRIITKGISGLSINQVLYYNRKHFSSNTGEFRNRHPERVKSKTNAIKLVTDNLKQRKLLSPDLVRYFLRLGFQLKEREVIEYVLQITNASYSKRMKYLFGYFIYPILKPVFRMKGKFFKQ